MEYLTGNHIFNEHPKAQVAANLENHFVIILAANCLRSLELRTSHAHLSGFSFFLARSEPPAVCLSAKEEKI